MKKIGLILLTFVALAVLNSCGEKEGHVKITNNVHNVKLETITFEGKYIASSLIPGESGTCVISGNQDDFPKAGPIQFYMVRDKNKVFLKTKEIFELKAGGNLEISINDSTEVVNTAGQ